MSDNILKFIPVDPEYIPDDHVQESALELLTAWLPAAELVNGTVSDDIGFVDQGANWVRVLCPACGAELDVDQWQAFMDAAYPTQFTDLTVTMPCCGAVGSLNDLYYEWPAGFARYVLEALNPNADIDDEQFYQLEQLLGCNLRKIWAQY